MDELLIPMSQVKTTAAERKAIERLQKAINKMPKTLWLFNNGSMHVMKYGPDGEPVENPIRGIYTSGGFNADYCVAEIEGIVSDGGDW